MNKLVKYLSKPVSPAPLATFRVMFGIAMAISMIRFMVYGWVESLYVEPQYYFTYWGLDFIKPLSKLGMYAVFILATLSALGMALGKWYRCSAALFFLSFTYIELLDVTNYLNHYYFISVVALVMCFLPAGRYWSLDNLSQPQKGIQSIERGYLLAPQLLLSLVYFYAGIAKINYDWLIQAQPLAIWLPARSDMPLIGGLFQYEITAYIFCWAGMIYDLTIPFLLLNKKTRPMAYMAVVGFHVITGLLFQIGMFPVIMIMCTTVFFSSKWHQNFQNRISSIFKISRNSSAQHYSSNTAIKWALGLFIGFQLLFPFRYLLYPGNVYWTEQGYRFGWRVMLMEKAGAAYFTVVDEESGNSVEISNADFLTLQQEKQMSFQPDMILQFAHHIAEVYKEKGFSKPAVYADVYVTLNGRGSQQFIDHKVNLVNQKEGFHNKTWILPLK